MGMPAVFTDKLMLRIQCRDHESVPYGVFCRGVVSCLVLKDFCQQLKSLYKMLDVLHEGTADRHLCEAALKEMDSMDSNVQQ
jgi:tubulin polyglutamylase complex subunit 1